MLSECEVKAQTLYDSLERYAIEGVGASIGPPVGTYEPVLDSFSVATALIRDIQTSLSSLPRRSRRMERTKTVRAEVARKVSRYVIDTTQAWKYVCTGSGGQINNVQEGLGRMTVTSNDHRGRGAVPIR